MTTQHSAFGPAADPDRVLEQSMRDDIRGQLALLAYRVAVLPIDTRTDAGVPVVTSLR